MFSVFKIMGILLLRAKEFHRICKVLRIILWIHKGQLQIFHWNNNLEQEKESFNNYKTAKKIK